MRMAKGHRYKVAAAQRVQAYEPKSKWADLTAPFTCKDPAVDVATIAGYDKASAIQIELDADKTPRYLDGADVADVTKWDLPDRPTSGESEVADHKAKGNLDHVAGYLTPWDTAGGEGARMVGFRDPKLDWRTEVTWGPLTKGYVNDEGTWMEATRLGPDHPRGGDTDDVTRTNNVAIANALGVDTKSWIAGHLLNDWLGGNGHEPKNIVAIPHKANVQMSGFEELVKAEVNAKGNWVYYKVEVEHGGTKPVANKVVMQYQLLDNTGARTGDLHKRTITIPPLEPSKKNAADDYMSKIKDTSYNWFADDALGGVDPVNAQRSEIHESGLFARPLESERANKVGDWQRSFPFNPSRNEKDVDAFLKEKISTNKTNVRTSSLMVQASEDGYFLEESKRRGREGEYTLSRLPEKTREKKEKEKAKRDKDRERDRDRDRDRLKKVKKEKEVTPAQGYDHLRTYAKDRILEEDEESATNSHYNGWYVTQALEGKTASSKRQRAKGLDDTQKSAIRKTDTYLNYQSTKAQQNDVGRAEAMSAFQKAGHAATDFGAVWTAFNQVVGVLPSTDFEDFVKTTYTNFLASGEDDLAGWLEVNLMS